MVDWRVKIQLLTALIGIAAAGWIVLAVRGPGSGPSPSRAAEPSQDGTLIIPVRGVRASQLTDTFTQAREGGARPHDAIDIVAPLGTPVLAATAGTVEKLFTSRAGGLTIYQRSPDRRTIYYYAHLDHYAPDLTEAQAVRQGQVIGAVGYTGNASPIAPHLHFAIMRTRPEAKWYEQAQAINPYPLLAGK